MCLVAGCGLYVILLGAAGMPCGLGSLDGVLGAGAVRVTPCRFLYYLINLGIRDAGVGCLVRGLRVSL